MIIYHFNFFKSDKTLLSLIAAGIKVFAASIPALS